MFIVSTISYKVLISYKGKACEGQKRTSLPHVSYHFLSYPLETELTRLADLFQPLQNCSYRMAVEFMRLVLALTISRLHFK